MNPFDDTDQHLPETFAARFASPAELLTPEEDVQMFTWPVPRVATALAVKEVAPDLSAEDRDDLVGRLDEVATEWVRRSDWDAIGDAPVAAT